MKTLIFANNYNNVIFDKETQEVSVLEKIRMCIDYTYVAPEDMHIVHKYGDKERELDVKKGDIIVTFYGNDCKYNIIAFSNAEWLENAEAIKEAEQREKEAWAKEKKCKPCDECCGNCCDSEPTDSVG